MNYDWADLAFASKKPLNELDAVFIMAPRELSPARFKQLVKTYLPGGNLILGLAKDAYVLGLENQPQFKMLQIETVQSIIRQVNTSSSAHKITTLTYFQREISFVLEKLDLKKVVLINGSWYHAFHQRPEFYILTKRRIEYDMVSPFADEQEAKRYADIFKPAEVPAETGSLLTEAEMLVAAATVAKQSFAYSEHQVGVALGRKQGARYELLATTHNNVVPYETYAMHHGASRERHFSPSNDLNHYDVNHAEIEMIVWAQKRGMDLTGATLFINLLPCPTCARMFTITDIAEFVYREDHSDGYAVQMLEAAGKTVRRLI